MELLLDSLVAALLLFSQKDLHMNNHCNHSPPNNIPPNETLHVNYVKGGKK